MRLSTLVLSGFLPASAFGRILLRASRHEGCHGIDDRVVSLDLVNVDQCNNLAGGKNVQSARATGLDGCIVTLFAKSGCDPDSGMISMDENSVCEESDTFRTNSYDVSC